MPPSFRHSTLPPRCPLPSKLEDRATSLIDPGPEHLPVPLDGDVAESRDLDSTCSKEEFLRNSNSENTPNTGSHQPKFSWRGKKISSTDVASVGNASDTGIQWNQSVSTTGRELHESAKMALNAGKYENALELFEAILEAQVKRFGACHASVAAAMHNVGGEFALSARFYMSRII